MGATLEPITTTPIFLLRSGESHENHGDPYSFAAVVAIIGDVAEIKGATGRISDIPAIREKMKEMGIRQVKWHRSVSGEMILHTVEV